MCYMYNQWYDISCATLYLIDSSFLNRLLKVNSQLVAEEYFSSLQSICRYAEEITTAQTTTFRCRIFKSACSLLETDGLLEGCMEF